ncbi:MAG: hypothetical protein ACD_39C01767G0005 [uncultured bacterium]|nr:MAG: hypothetical protein ACD_39C01767G0005 [uncultured bacterium]
MFRAQNKLNGNFLVSIDPVWLSQKEVLADICQTDQVICPYCKEPVRLRAGKYRRWYFAHKTLLNCPFTHESPTVLEARAALYEWLLTKVPSKPGWSVDVEIPTGDPSMKKRVDCLLKSQSKAFAYIIFDKSVKLGTRQELQDQICQKGWHLNVLFAMDFFKPANYPNSVLLSTTERDFLTMTEFDLFDEIGQESFGSLFYINGKTREIKVIRRASLMHSPQIFEGEIFDEELQKVLISPKTGELVLPGEYEKLQALKEAKRAQEKRDNEHRERILQEQLAMMKKTETRSERTGSEILKQTLLEPPPENHQQTQASLPVCLICHQPSSDWWYYDGITNTCKCQNCSDRNKKPRT